MFGNLPPASAMDMDGNTLPLSTEELEFETNWALMNEVLRELEMEQLQGIPDEQPEYIPSIEEFDQTYCPICLNSSLYQFATNQPVICRQCPFQYNLSAGSLVELHRYHRQRMSDCSSNELRTTLWNNDDGSSPSLLVVCTKCDFNFCL